MNIHAIPNNSKFKVEMILGHKTQSRSYSDCRMDFNQTDFYLWIFCWVKISNVVRTKLLSMRSMVFCLGHKSHRHSERRERLRLARISRVVVECHQRAARSPKEDSARAVRYNLSPANEDPNLCFRKKGIKHCNNLGWQREGRMIRTIS